MTITASRTRVGQLIRASAFVGPILLGVLLAFHLRRLGHTEGDDFALYLRQARSIFDGDFATVIADNRFAVINSDPGFSPLAYPWGWPLLASPFVNTWGFDYDRLKLVEIAAFATWLALFHGIVRRRLGRLVASGLVTVLATSAAYLGHTDELLSEFPHLVAVSAVLCWHDRIRSRGSLVHGPERDLIVLGLLTVAAYNIRRESLVLVPMIVIMQFVEIWRASPNRDMSSLLESVQRSYRTVALPVLSFVIGVITFQLLLPTELFPDNGNSVGFIVDRWSEAPLVVAGQLGIGGHRLVAAGLVLLATAGALISLRQRLVLDAPLVITAGLTMVVIGTHVRQIDRYWLQVTPWVLYFVAVAFVATTRVVLGRLSTLDARTLHRWAACVAVVPALVLGCFHLVSVADDIRDTRTANSNGIVQDGPAHPLSVEMTNAVMELTPPDAVVTYYRARTMTLLTDRRSIQTRDVERIRARSDYWVQRRDWSFWQPDLDESRVSGLGFVEVWSNERYVVWCTRCSG